MHMKFERPPLFSEKEWEIFDPTRALDNISNSLDRIKNNDKELSGAGINQLQTDLIKDLFQLNFLITEHLKWFEEQELTQLIYALDTAQPTSSVWEKNRKFAFQIIDYLILIEKMSMQAQSATADLMILSGRKE